MLCAEGFACLLLREALEEVEKFSAVSLPSGVEASLRLPWSQASCPPSLVTLRPSPGACSVPLRPPNHPRGLGCSFKPLPPTVSPTSEKSSCSQNMG